jgi:YfiH family protein
MNSPFFFSLEFTPDEPARACFPFIYDGAAAGPPFCAVSSRSAGDMAPGSPARERFLRALGLDAALVFSVTQSHSRKVTFADRRSPNRPGEADGLASRDSAVSLAVTVADCLPVFLYDVEGGAFALVHSGWRGTGIALEALRLMRERWQSRPETTAAVLGPCIRGCCYQVDKERALAFRAEFGGGGGPFPLGPVVSERPGGSGGTGFFIDLQAANARLLAGAGVRNIAVCRDCTFTGGQLGSFRREGAASYTRMLAVLANTAAAR